MSKTDRPPIFMARTHVGLIPAAPVDDERLQEYAFNSVVEVTVRQRRSGPNHRHYWLVLSKLVSAGAVPFSTCEELDQALKLACGITKLQRTLGGDYIVVPGSISYAARDEGAFVSYKKRAWELLARHYGVDFDELEAAHAA